MRPRAWVVVAAVAIGFLGAAAAHGAPLAREAVPAPLQPWIDWVLHGQEAATCTPLLGDAERRECAWPSQLTLALDDNGGTFAQEWEVERARWVPLPGAQQPWPQEVMVDGGGAVVVPRDGVPHVHLDAGRHRVTGRFLWDALPEMVPVPAATGLVTLTVRGEAVAFPERGGNGRLWLQRRAAPSAGEDRLELIVHRLLDDAVPLQLDTRIELEVSGAAREVLLGPALPEGFVPVALHAPLPARIEADGRLRLQVRPGEWSVQIAALRNAATSAVSAPTPTDAWAAQEIWVFSAHPELRLVTVEGADAVDPQQTNLPPEWRRFPAYLLAPGATLRLVERRRGDVDGTPDQLALQRRLWLDFDGGGYTVQDRITGTLSRSWRLDMAPPVVPGRVAVNGRDQFVTRLAPDGPAGVELRDPALQLEADSRIEDARGTLPAVGWLHDFQSLSAELYLPPGWRLLHARGVDLAQPTWVGTWTLLDLFLVLITALATARLFGWLWGLVALLAIGLSYTEPAAPHGIWLAVLALEALVRLVPEGTARRALRLGCGLALVALVVLVVPFLVAQVQAALYPVLELPHQRLEAGEDAVGAPASAPPSDELRDYKASREDSAAAPPRYFEYGAVDPQAMVQTGPGLPDWTWRAAVLRWSGPVDQEQRLRLYLLPPAFTAALAVLRVLLLALLVARLTGLRAAALRGGGAPVAAVVTLLLALPPPARAELPSEALLAELRARLLAPADCQPWCASLPHMRLTVTPQALRAVVRVEVAASTAVPLPGQAQHWLPRAVLVDGQPATGLLQGADGALWLRLPPGTHEVLVEGPLPARDTVQVPLRLAPRRLETEVDGWTLAGAHADGTSDASLQLSRLAPLASAGIEPLEAGQLPPFAQVERRIRLGLTWEAETRVVRLSPADGALVAAVPLLPGEAVTTPGVRVVDGAAQVHLAPPAAELRWRSTLDARSPLMLRAAEGVLWSEEWQLDASPLWHVEADGIPPVSRAESAAPALRVWRPWPGESVTLTIARPAGVPGQTLTIDASTLHVEPGLRATDATLDLVLRSSRGTQHTVGLPESAELVSASIDGSVLPLGQEGRAVVLPIDPGRHAVRLAWREPHGITSRLRTAPVDLGAPSVNTRLQVTMPASRWILFAGGPRVGPAVLFWSLLPVLALIAFALGRIRLTPLRAPHWFLLGIGLTQVPIGAAVIVAGWLLALGWRRERGSALDPGAFDLVQLLLVGWTLTAIGILFFAIQQGLLGQPDMQIAGNGSSAAVLRWYQDRSAAVLPRAWILSVPLLVYRLLMLAWALWIAQALLRWLRWGWDAFGTGGYWRSLRVRKAT